MKISVVGCGRWGSLITWYLSEKKGFDLTLYGRANSKNMQKFLTERKNELLTLPQSVKLTTDISSVCDSDIIIIGCGNILFKDDGFGPILINILQK